MTPSEAIAAGKCSGCLGTGRVDRCVPYDDVFPCSSCGGDGLHPPRCFECGDRHLTVEEHDACPGRRIAFDTP